MQERRGRRLVGRVTATVAALVLAGAAVVLLGQGTTGVALEASRGTTVAADAPATATIIIESSGVSFAYDQPNYDLAVGGQLDVINHTGVPHTVTSVAQGTTGPLFDMYIPAGGPSSTVSTPIPAASALKDGTYAFFCSFHKQFMKSQLTVGAGGPVVTEPPGGYTQALTQPPRLTGKNLKIVMKQALVQVLPGQKTSMMTYGGTFPGPTIVRPAGADTKVTFVNRLPRADGAMTIHLHAGHQKSKFDGQPASYLIRHGRARTYDYPMRDAGKPLPAALRFYHDHRMDRTARDNWFGLQGMFLTTSPHDAKIGLPHGKYDIPLDVAERSFDANNQLTNPFGTAGMSMGGPGTETIGDKVLVNGRYAPYKVVQPGLYRLQILNSSLFSSYDFALSNGQPITQIGTGSGLLPHPVVRQDIPLGPAQRADVVIDLRSSVNKDVELQTITPTQDATNGLGLMQFRVRGTPAPRASVPSTLTRIQRLDVPTRTAMTWRFGLNSDNHWTINGKRFDPSRVDHKVRVGRTERWALVNDSAFTHYVHLHEELWQTISRDGKRPPPWERGYEDTWRLDPGETVVVAAKFTDFTGNFMLHCHMLDHEDDGMMATFRVVR